MMGNLSNKRIIACCLFPVILLLSGCKSTIPQKIDLTACPIDQRSARALGQSTAKLVQASFHAYQQRDIAGAINFLLSIQAKNTFDRAYVDQMLGNFYAEQGQMDKALEYLTLAINADVLGGRNHAGTLRLYADLLLNTKQYEQAISYYYAWIKFTCKQDASIYKRISIAYIENKQWEQALNAANIGLNILNYPNKDLLEIKLTAYLNLRQPENVVKLLEEMTTLWPSDQILQSHFTQLSFLTKDEKVKPKNDDSISKTQVDSVDEGSLINKNYGPKSIVRKEPGYPIAAARDGIEGGVRMSFSVDHQGQTKNIKVIESWPDGVFDEEAVLALSKWLYKPKIINNKPVQTDNLELILEFKLIKEGR